MQKLSIIQNKRLRKEVGIYLNQYQDKINNINCLRIIEGASLINYTFNSVTFLLSIDDIRSLHTTIKISDDYPFKKPCIVSINDKIYSEYLRVPYIFLEDVNYKAQCLCCSSILCNWYASYGIHHILKEIKEVFKLKIRIVERILCKKIIDQYFGFYIPIIEFI